MDLSIHTMLFLIFSICLWYGQTRPTYRIIALDGTHGKLLWQDDSSLNGIRLYCSDGTQIESRVGPVAKPQPLWIFGDDTGATNIKFKCGDDTELEGRGHTWGKYGHWSSSCFPASICGLRTRIDSTRPWLDISGLNDVLFYCCL
ncbi:vitelline membrane outer layer protein 1 homolog [Tiliqua scincoides]|uniref:vitelline membrane outer layer protein 1 homolog n=1 Tax=Tiliqua scincoides TaxID=71010 RepID=UPI003462870E